MTSSSLAETYLPWQKNLWDSLFAQVDASRLPHALLFSGVAGLGKRQLAIAFVQALLCKDKSQTIACGNCKSCLLFQSDTHPDFLLLEPEGTSKAIKVDQIRDVVNLIGKTAQQGGYKCVVIHPAEAMNNNAYNALLKSLEEPQGDAYIILVSASPSRLPATVRSRCQNINFTKPDESIALKWLQSQIEGDPKALLDEFAGAPCAALLAHREGKLALKQSLADTLARIISGSMSGSEASKSLAAMEVIDIFDNVLAWIGEVLAFQLAGQAARHPSSKTLLPSLAMVNSDWLFRFRDKLLETKRLLESNANPNKQLVIDELLMDLQAMTARRSGRNVSARRSL
ncbi:DNA polymerase III subunit delta' [Aurantivibrio infirmus]